MKETDHPWIRVTYDETEFSVFYEKPEEDNWVRKYYWHEIVKICFKSYDYGAPDFIYVFLKNSEDPCIIPNHGSSNEQFWKEIKHRELFNPNLEIIADTSQVQYHCWPRE